MKYLNQEIERLSKKSLQKSLVKKGASCGIFQELGIDAKPQNTRESIEK